MQEAWVAGLSEEEAQTIRDDFAATRYLFDRMLVILNKWEQDSLKKIKSEKIFELPSWKDKINNELAFQRALEKFKTLIKE